MNKDSIKITLQPCASYDVDVALQAVRACFDVFGGVEKVVGRGKRVALKVNLLMKKRPELACTTHPRLVEAVTQVLREHGNIVIITESPAGPFSEAQLRSIYKACGIDEAAASCGALLNYDTSSTAVPCPDGEVCKVFNLLTPIVEADAVVNLCRLKTHALCYMSAAVKNLFGCIPGMEKIEFHSRFTETNDFAGMLLDLCGMVNPTFSIVDAVMAMEGNGPSGGSPRYMGALVAGTNPYAADALCERLIGYGEGEVHTVALSVKRGLTPPVGELEVVGADPADFIQKDFAKPDSYIGGYTPKFRGIIGLDTVKKFRPRPVVEKKKCVGCGICVSHCPVATIRMDNKKAFVEPDKCIRCFCCQELCPQKAVKIKKNLLFRLLK
ncbi:MAG: DUF362 domain-containing protein [Eubacteriales bacterium]